MPKCSATDPRARTGKQVNLADAVGEGARMAEVFDAKRVRFLANQGVVVVGRNVAEAFDDIHYLEHACQLAYCLRVSR